jgi:uroporphyrinogen-III synthase
VTPALEGLTVVVTRPARQAGPFVAMLREAGADPILLPAIEIEPIELDAASRAKLVPDDFDWTVYTSANAVQWSVQQLPRPARTHVAAIGHATARALDEHGVRVDAVPQGASESEGLLALGSFADLRGQRILIVKGAGAACCCAKSWLVAAPRSCSARCTGGDPPQRIRRHSRRCATPATAPA